MGLDARARHLGSEALASLPGHCSLVDLFEVGEGRWNIHQETDIPHSPVGEERVEHHRGYQIESRHFRTGLGDHFGGGWVVTWNAEAGTQNSDRTRSTDPPRPRPGFLPCSWVPPVPSHQSDHSAVLPRWRQNSACPILRLASLLQSRTPRTPWVHTTLDGRDQAAVPSGPYPFVLAVYH